MRLLSFSPVEKLGEPIGLVRYNWLGWGRALSYREAEAAQLRLAAKYVGTPAQAFHLDQAEKNRTWADLTSEAERLASEME